MKYLKKFNEEVNPQWLVKGDNEKEVDINGKKYLVKYMETHIDDNIAVISDNPSHKNYTYRADIFDADNLNWIVIGEI